MEAARAGRSIVRKSTRHALARSYAQVAAGPSALNLNTPSIFQQAVNATEPRTNWTKDEISQIHQTPLMELAFAAVSLRS